MIFTILSEPRSGSTNLYFWLKNSLDDFIVLTETSNPISIDFRSTNLLSFDWIDKNKNYIINEKFTSGVDMSKLISISNKIACLYREDVISQIESFIIAEKTGNWRFPYKADSHVINHIDTIYADRKKYFEELKKDFKDFRERYKLKSFTYEELYYGGKINELQEYFGLRIENKFPYGDKLRIDKQIERLI